MRLDEQEDNLLGLLVGQLPKGLDLELARTDPENGGMANKLVRHN
jgi:hypothetical protein